MGLLQILPAQEQLVGILAPILGDEASDTGIASVLKFLEEIDTDNLSSSMAARLDQMVTAGIQMDPEILTGSVFEQFQQILDSLPANPDELIAPMASNLEVIKNLSSSNLSEQLLTGIDGLQNIEALIPANTQELLGSAADQFTALKGEFISGTFGQIRQWSDSVGVLYDELEPLLTNGPGTLEERLIGFLDEKVSDLIRLILPRGNPATLFSEMTDTAILADRVSELVQMKADVITAMNLANADFQRGNFTNTIHLANAQTAFLQLTDTLGDIAGKLRVVFDQEISTPEGLARALNRQLDEFSQIDIVDLGNIRDKFTEAINKLEVTIEDLDLEATREIIENAFEQLHEVIDQFDLGQLSARISELKTELETALERLDSSLFETVASIRDIFGRLKDTLQSVAATFGSYDENGEFSFFIQQDIENFLSDIRLILERTLKPMLDQFKEQINQALTQVAEELEAVQEEVEDTKNQLLAALQDVNNQLQSLNVTDTMNAARAELDSMLNDLGSIDYDPLVDPVVGQVNEMRDDLRNIDVSSLNEFTIGALKVAVEVVVAVDFSTQITNVLMDEFDSLLDIPKRAIDDIEAEVENVLQKFKELEPDALLSPLDDLFDPVTTHLDNLDLTSLLEPLDSWYEQTQQELEKVSPVSLLQPLIDLHTQLFEGFNTLSPEALIQPLQEAIDSVKEEIETIDISGLTAEVSRIIDDFTERLNDISPERLLVPLIDAFDKIMGALDRFNPGALLEPFGSIFGALAQPLASLTEDHAISINDAFTSLRSVFDAFDPRQLFQSMRETSVAVGELLDEADIGGLIADLREPFNSMVASLPAEGDAENGYPSINVAELNPLENIAITRSASDFQRFQSQLSAWADAGPPSELIARYDEIKPKLESLVPEWVGETISADSVRRAFEAANPLHIEAEVNQLYETIKNQLRNFDPRILQENLTETFDRIQDAILGIDPVALTSEVQSLIDDITKRVDAIDLQIIEDELLGVVEEIQTIIAGLNPSPIIDQLQAEVDGVRNRLSELQPSEVLGDLSGPLGTADDIVAAFDPAGFKEPLEETFDNIRSVIEHIDVSIVLQPIVDRLDQLRDELENGLNRTETAFNGMIAAIPV
ncbi:hypothetical protein JY97_13515 [Alkalispirochaeta odontotermitis]|nr:hypothetical protein JY97_13515 [Alkalispirochaeta odontotermitis]CAB1073575.1 hypothetical protein D1AOALGA4SA_1890 [Olavius algarvensis Delta 1 endosymbiont]